MKTPGEKAHSREEEENMRPLLASEASHYRALAARANYLAQDRADIAFAAKEVCRGMSAPTVGHMRALRRLGRYLITAPRVIWRFPWQDNIRELVVYSDSDWAGCNRTGRSTSGGALPEAPTASAPTA